MSTTKEKFQLPSDVEGGEGIPYGPGGKQWNETLSSLAVSSKGKLLTSPPSRDPLSLQEYARVSSHVTGSNYQVPSLGLSQDELDTAHRETLDFLEGQAKNCMGYQCDLNMPHYEKTLPPYLHFLGNNVGDPFSAGTYTIHTKWMECNVLDYFASLWNGKWPYKLEDPDTYWGYVLTMGSTEGNLYAAWNARDYLSGKYLYYDPPALRRAYEEIKARKGMTSLPSGYTYGQARLEVDENRTEEKNENAFSPVVFYSEETHYSNFKATHAIGIPSFYSVAMEKYPGQCPLPDSNGTWPPDVPCKDGALGPGSIDIDALAKLVDFFTSKGHPIFIILNYGSTFKGSYDDVEMVGETLIPILKNMKERS